MSSNKDFFKSFGNSVRTSVVHSEPFGSFFIIFNILSYKILVVNVYHSRLQKNGKAYIKKLQQPAVTALLAKPQFDAA